MSIFTSHYLGICLRMSHLGSSHSPDKSIVIIVKDEEKMYCESSVKFE
jgi:hypothetical protein